MIASRLKETILMNKECLFHLQVQLGTSLQQDETCRAVHGLRSTHQRSVFPQVGQFSCQQIMASTCGQSATEQSETRSRSNCRGH